LVTGSKNLPAHAVESRKICKFWKTISQSILGGFIPNQNRNVDLDESFPSGFCPSMIS